MASSLKVDDAYFDSILETTLTTHFFGRKGDHKLTFDEFSAFIAGFQKEVLWAEFLEYSRGMETISEIDFANLLLRYTDLSEEVSFIFLLIN